MQRTLQANKNLQPDVATPYALNSVANIARYVKYLIQAPQMSRYRGWICRYAIKSTRSRTVPWLRKIWNNEIRIGSLASAMVPRSWASRQFGRFRDSGTNQSLGVSP